MSLQHRMESIRIVKANNTVYMADMFNREGVRVATFYTEHLLGNVLHSLFGLGDFEPIPYSEGASVVSGAPDKRSQSKMAITENKKYVKSLTKYVKRTVNPEKAAEWFSAVWEQTIYAEQTKIDEVFFLEAFPYDSRERAWLKEHGWMVAK